MRTLGASLWNRKAILDEQAFFNYQGFSGGQFVLVFLVIMPPLVAFRPPPRLGLTSVTRSERCDGGGWARRRDPFVLRRRVDAGAAAAYRARPPRHRHRFALLRPMDQLQPFVEAFLPLFVAINVLSVLPLFIALTRCSGYSRTWTSSPTPIGDDSIRDLSG